MDHDLIIIGGGAAGLSAARAALWAKADVALISDSPLGGDCTFSGCVPSKTMLASARDGLGFDEAMARVRSTIEHIAAGESADVLRSRGATVIEGRARFVTHDTVLVGGRRITAPRIIIATGSGPAMPEIDGISAVEPLSNETIFDLATAPRSLAIIGGGALGCEFAQALSGFGIVVTLIENRERILGDEETEASAVLGAALVAGGCKVRTATTIRRLELDEHGHSRVVCDDAELTVDRVLAATGRSPHTADLGLDGLGVKCDGRGHVVTSSRLATTVKGIYAAGDVTGLMPFTHAADEMGRLAVGNALRRGLRGRFSSHCIPWTVFTAPELARVGVTEAGAPAGSRVAYLPLSELDRAITDELTDGFIKIVAGPRRILGDSAGGKVLGATIVAPRAGEMIGEIVLVMRTRAFAGRLAQAVHAYPTWSYGIQKTAAQFFGAVEGRQARRLGG